MKHLILSENTTFEDAVRLLDQNGNGFLAVVDEDSKLIGILTDGDIRRAILNKKTELEDIINFKPKFAESNMPRPKIREWLKQIHRRHMPVVDKNGKLLEVVILNDFEVVPKENWVVIMAGGLGTRLGALTQDTPKPMLHVGDKPMLDHIISNYKQYGFYKFVLCLNYKAEVIEEYFGDGSEFGITIKYTKENKRLGTAGALSLISFDLKEPFFVTNGDIITSVNFEDLMNTHTREQSVATMCIKNHDVQLPFACVETDDHGSLVSISEKPNISFNINAGVYVLDPKVIGLIPKDTYYDMPTLFEALGAQGEKVGTFKIHEDYWLDIGRPNDYDKGNDDLKRLP